MANINFTGNPQQAAATVGGILAFLATAPAWAIGLGVAAAVGGAAYVINKANKEE